jgi:hypothetical protein
MKLPSPGHKATRYHMEHCSFGSGESSGRYASVTTPVLTRQKNRDLQLSIYFNPRFARHHLITCDHITTKEGTELVDVFVAEPTDTLARVANAKLIYTDFSSGVAPRYVNGTSFYRLSLPEVTDPYQIAFHVEAPDLRMPIILASNSAGTKTFHYYGRNLFMRLHDKFEEMRIVCPATSFCASMALPAAESPMY